jgi:DNA-binding NarL/FixJ family response regulator
VIKIYIKASSAVTRAGLESLLREDFRVAITSSESQADVVLLEMANAERISPAVNANRLRSAPIVLIADPLTRSELRHALHSGVRSVLPRNANATEILAAIEGAAAGMTVLTSEDMDLLLPASAESTDDHLVHGEPLSVREMEVLAMMAEGMANKEIAAQLNISEHTVKFHVSSILGKLGASNRGEAVARGVRDGLIMI